MDRFDFDDVELTYELRERGERVVLVHASAFVSWYRPLVEQLPDFRPCATGAASAVRRRRVPPPHRRRGRGHLRPADGSRRLAYRPRRRSLVRRPGRPPTGDRRHRDGSVRLRCSSPPPAASPAQNRSCGRAAAGHRRLQVRRHRPVQSTGSCATSAATATAACWTGWSQAPSMRRSARQTCSSRRRCLPCSSGASGPTTPSGSRNLCSMCSGRGQRPALRGRKRAGAVVVPRAERLTVPEAGHLLMVQNPMAIAHGLSAFFSRHPASPSPAEGLVVGFRDGSRSGR